MFEKNHNDMESLKFVMYYSRNSLNYGFKSYPGFVNRKYMYQDLQETSLEDNCYIIDKHKFYIFYGTKTRTELLDTIRDKGPDYVFRSLDDALKSG